MANIPRICSHCKERKVACPDSISSYWCFNCMYGEEKVVTAPIVPVCEPQIIAPEIVPEPIEVEVLPEETVSDVDLLRDMYRRVNNRGITEARRYRELGVSFEDYQIMHKVQNGLCAVCGKPETAKRGGNVKMLAVDHSHSTGTVRELLCSACNIALGMLNDDPERIRLLADYAEKWKDL